jgi:hypothetical protein
MKSKVKMKGMIKGSQKKAKNELEELRVLCREGNTEWIEKRPKGYFVIYEKGNNYLIHRNDAEKKEYLRCSNCGSQSKIARLPLKSVMKVK